jgi:hypothetical protein
MSRFRPGRPSPALVVATIALIAALGGTAYAGFSLPKNSVGTKQLKKNAVTTSKIKNGAVTAGKINPAGLTVPNALHANSSNTASSATNATNATTATNAASLGGSPAGSYVQYGATLKSGATEKGIWADVATAGASGEVTVGTVFFPIPLASNPTAHFIPSGTTPPSGCSGTLAAPAASPGNLCVFESFPSINLTHLDFYNPETNSETATASGKTGALAVFTANAAGETQATGTWAVTAP